MLCCGVSAIAAVSPPLTLPSAEDTDHDGLLDDWERGFGRYEIIAGTFTWAEAKADAEQRGAHLATVIHAREWTDLKAVLGEQLNGKNLWLGGTDEGTEGSWRWITGEKWSFTNWRVNEPGNDSLGNGQGQVENYLMIWGHETETRDGHQAYWNDATLNGGLLARDGYILERETWTDPNNADTDGDGISDGDEVRMYKTNPNLRDTDGDGASDKFEIEQGSDPTLASSVPTVPIRIRRVVELEVTGKAGVLYDLQSSEREGVWEAVETLVGNGSPITRFVLSSMGLRSRWRARLNPRPYFPGLAWIPPGKFMMGSPTSEAERFENETQHEVTLTKGFWMGKYEVTQEEYTSVIGSNPSYFRNGVDAISSGTGGNVTNDVRHPVENVTWHDATNYCAKLTQGDRSAGKIPAGYSYRLPTEAEWEYACRGGTTTAFHFGNAIRQGMANFYTLLEYDSAVGSQQQPNNRWIGRTVETGSYAPNAYGLYDIHGNVWEWCSDRYGDYGNAAAIDPTGPTSGDYRVFRGGGGGYYGGYCRAAFRSIIVPDYRDYGIGFRVVLSPGQ